MGEKDIVVDILGFEAVEQIIAVPVTSDADSRLRIEWDEIGLVAGDVLVIGGVVLG